MRKIKLFAWLLCFIFVCGLIVLPAGRGPLQQFVSAHPGVPIYLLLALLLAIPGNIVTLATAFLFEWLMVGWSRSSLKTLWEARASVKLDALSIAMSLLPLGRLGYILSLGLLFAIDTHSVKPQNISLTHFLPLWGIQVTVLVLFQSFMSYWMHRLEHAIPALWALHKFHHSADRMSIFTSQRRTVLAKGMEEALLFIPALLLTDPIAPKPARSYHDKNFTFDLVIWDRLFGTYATCDAAAVADIPLGLDDNPFNDRSTLMGVLRNYFLTPYLVFWYELRTGFKAWLPARLNREQSSVVV